MMLLALILIQCTFAATKFENNQGISSFTFEYVSHNLNKITKTHFAIASSIHDIAQLDTISSNSPYSQSTRQILEKYQGKDHTDVRSSNSMDDLAKVFESSNIPFGLANPLYDNLKYGEYIFYIDDSDKMDHLAEDGLPVSRWDHAIETISKLTKILSHYHIHSIHVRFLHSAIHREFLRWGPGPVERSSTPAQFSSRVINTLRSMYNFRDTKGHPIQFQYPTNSNKQFVYIFVAAFPLQLEKIDHFLLSARGDPQSISWYPITVITYGDESPKLLHELNSQIIDFRIFGQEETTRKDIIRIHGEKFPYSTGTHLVGMLLSAFTTSMKDLLYGEEILIKESFDNMMGYALSRKEYELYSNARQITANIIARSKIAEKNSKV